MNDINKGLINIIVDEINVGQINKNNNQNEQVSRSILRVVPFQKTQPLQPIQSVQGNQLVQLQSVSEFISNIDFLSLFGITEETFNNKCFIASHN